jgi:hypothetical protein
MLTRFNLQKQIVHWGKAMEGLYTLLPLLKEKRVHKLRIRFMCYINKLVSGIRS